MPRTPPKVSKLDNPPPLRLTFKPYAQQQGLLELLKDNSSYSTKCIVMLAKIVVSLTANYSNYNLLLVFKQYFT